MNEGTLKIVRDAVREEIKVTVNGQIEKIKEHLFEQDKKLETVVEKIDDLKPLIEAKNTLFNITQFIKWVALPASVLYGCFRVLIGAK